MSDEMVVGILQANLGGEPVENALKISSMVRSRFKEADIILTPEYSMANPFKVGDPKSFYEKAEGIGDSRFLSILEKTASETGSLILTHFIEKTSTPPKTRSSSVLITPGGERRRVYSKIHLFNAYGFREGDFFEEGSQTSMPLNVKGFTVRVAICYDLRFPELFRLYAWEGADVVLLHAGWVRGYLKESQLDFLARARAHENTIYLAVSNQVGELFTGGSGLYSPLGYKVYDLGFSEKYVEVSMEREEIALARKLIPVVEQSRAKWNIREKREGAL
jgi:predicted amidohydrolase